MADPRNLYQKMHAIMRACPRLVREQKSGMRYKIISHDAVTEAVRQPMIDAGVMYLASVISHGQDGDRTVAEVEVTFVNIDNPAERVSVRAFGYGIDNSDKGPGKAISYATKYCLMKALGLETGEDSDYEDRPHGKIRPGQSAKPTVHPRDVARIRELATDAELAALEAKYPNGIDTDTQEKAINRLVEKRKQEAAEALKSAPQNQADTVAQEEFWATVGHIPRENPIVAQLAAMFSLGQIHAGDLSAAVKTVYATAKTLGDIPTERDRMTVLRKCRAMAEADLAKAGAAAAKGGAA